MIARRAIFCYTGGMKNAIILHGTGDKNDMYWFPYVKRAGVYPVRISAMDIMYCTE